MDPLAGFATWLVGWLGGHAADALVLRGERQAAQLRGCVFSGSLFAARRALRRGGMVPSDDDAYRLATMVHEFANAAVPPPRPGGPFGGGEALSVSLRQAVTEHFATLDGLPAPTGDTQAQVLGIRTGQFADDFTFGFTAAVQRTPALRELAQRLGDVVAMQLANLEEQVEARSSLEQDVGAALAQAKMLQARLGAAADEVHEFTTAVGQATDRLAALVATTPAERVVRRPDSVPAAVDEVVAPQEDSWVVAIHSSESDSQALGAGVVVDERRVLTCLHVVDDHADGELWVAFPKAPGLVDRCRVERIDHTQEPRVEGRARVRDAALLTLEGPVPSGVAAAPLRSPEANDLVPGRWWAFGFPLGDPVGYAAHGSIGASLGYGWVRLDTASRYAIAPGFSGGGLWSERYGAVVGLVGQADAKRGDGRALSLRWVEQLLPTAGLEALTVWTPPAAGEVALSAWGWTLEADVEGVRHWRPRARGVAVDSERGFRFRGRREALEKIVGWLQRAQPDRRVLVVTGSPGAGKSAVLGRVVTTSDAEAAAELPADDVAVGAPVGSVGCAVHVKGKTALEVATEIARAASAALPEQPKDLAVAVREVLQDRPRRFNVLVDALDEAATASEARQIVGDILLPLVQTCADVGVQVVVGTRRYDGEGDLLGVFGAGCEVVDLDDEAYFADEDLVAYALASLRLEGHERPGNPYLDRDAALPVAERIAALSERNFLVAGLEARQRGMFDAEAVDPTAVDFAGGVDRVLDDYLSRLEPIGTLPAREVLTVLAFAEAPGWPVDLWQAAVAALTGELVTGQDLARFARSAAAGLLVQTASGGEALVFRLYHQAFNDALQRSRSRSVAAEHHHRRLLEVFLDHAGAVGWEATPAYVRRSLPVHAARAEAVDRLLLDEGYLLHGDLRRLLMVAGQAHTPGGRERAQLLRLTADADYEPPPVRAAMFSITQQLERHHLAPLDPAALADAPYRSRWANVIPRAEFSMLEGHTGPVRAVCAVQVDGRTLLASGSDDRTVRLWDPADGIEVRRLAGHTGRVWAVCTVQVDGRTLLASGSTDRTVRLWNPSDGQRVRLLIGHTGPVTAVCAVQVDGRTLLASGSDDRTVRLWDPADGSELRRLRGHTGPVAAVCAVQVDGRTRLASGSADRTVRLWNPSDGRQVRRLTGPSGRVGALCTVEVNGRTRLAAGSNDRTVWLWNPAGGRQVRRLPGHYGSVGAVYAVQVDGRTLLASGSANGTVRLLDPADGTEVRRLAGHTEPVGAVCGVQVGGRTLLASGSNDRTVRLWDPGGAALRLFEGHTGWVGAVCAVRLNGRILLASGSADRTVRLWDPADGRQLCRLEGHTDWVRAVCAVPLDGRTLLASASDDRTVRLWEPADGTAVRRLEGHAGWVRALCTVQVDGRTLLASGSNDRTVLLWDPTDGTEVRRLEGHTGRVRALCTVQVDGRTLLASGSHDRTVLLWDPTDGTEVRRLEGHTGRVRALCTVQVDGRTLLASGSDDRTARLWDPTDGRQVRHLKGHTGRVWAVCVMEVDGRTLLASASHDRTVRIWEPFAGRPLETIAVRHPATALAGDGPVLFVGVASGVIALEHLPGSG